MPGLKTDVDPSENKGPAILGVMWALTMITLGLVIMRMYIRLHIVKAFGLDDWLIGVSMFMGLAYLGITTANVVIGYGKHAITLSMAQLQDAILLNSLGFVFGIMSFAIPKCGVIAMLCRILNPGKLNRVWLWSLGIFNVVASSGCIGLLFGMCTPRYALWKITTPGAVCMNPWILIHYSYFIGALSGFTDLYLAMYPTTVLFKLQMSLRKKLALSAALGLGTIAAAMAIVKIIQLPGLADKSDYTYGTAELVLWTNIEADVVVIASCIPTLQPLLERISKSKFGSRKDSKYFNKLEQGGSHGPSGSRSQKDRSGHRSNNRSVTNEISSQDSILDNKGMANAEIRRTDDVFVEYEMETRQPPPPRQKW